MDSSRVQTPAPARELHPSLFDVGSLLSYLQGLTDHRSRKGLRYPLPVVVLLIILAKLGGEDRPSGIADWVAFRAGELCRVLHLSLPRMPHHNTYRRIMAQGMGPEELDQAVHRFLRTLPEVGSGVLLSIDGKTVRGTVNLDKPKGEHLLAAYLPDEGIFLLQVAAGQKENEITVAPQLLEAVDLRGKIVAADAMHTQRKLTLQVLAAGGEYLWLAKGNQPNLQQDIAQLFAGEDRTVLGGQVPHDFERFVSYDQGHGRRERREITVSRELKGHCDWPGLEQVFCLTRQRTDLKTGKVECETVYGLTSLQREEASPERLLSLSRRYWGIENGLHYRRDVTFHEDGTRQTKGNAGRVMATINSLVISLLSHTGATNIAQARRKCSASLSYSISLTCACPLS